MSPRAARAVAFPFASLAFVLRLLDKFWIEPWTWGIAPEIASLLVGLAAFVASLGLPVGAYLLLTRRARRRPAAFDIDAPGRRFIAPTTPRWSALLVILGWLAAHSLITERVANQDRMRPTDFTFLLGFGVTAAVIALVVLAIAAFERGASLQLSPEGIIEQRPMKRITIGWDELVPGGPPPPITGDPAHLTVYTWTASSSFAPRQIPARAWHVDPVFLAHALRTYADHPKGRAAIGTPAELARLQETFAEAPGA